MDENKKPDAYCPNCQKPAIREGNEIICTRCDATFKITKTGAAHVAKIGRLEDLEQRMDRAERKMLKLMQDPGESSEPPESPESTETSGETETEDDLLPR